MRKTKKQIKQLRKEIRELRDKEDLTFQDIADITGLASHQLARYHYDLSTAPLANKKQRY